MRAITARTSASLSCPAKLGMPFLPFMMMARSWASENSSVRPADPSAGPTTPSSSPPWQSAQAAA